MEQGNKDISTNDHGPEYKWNGFSYKYGDHSRVGCKSRLTDISVYWNECVSCRKIKSGVKCFKSDITLSHFKTPEGVMCSLHFYRLLEVVFSQHHKQLWWHELRWSVHLSTFLHPKNPTLTQTFCDACTYSYYWSWLFPLSSSYYPPTEDLHI